VRELIFYLAEQLSGESRESMELTETAGRPGHYKLLVEPQAMGRLIGREGKVVKALRLLIEAAAMAQGLEASLDIDEKRG
jgi:predicted RNA-binding protein YlqC (UPF0109 family)